MEKYFYIFLTLSILFIKIFWINCQCANDDKLHIDFIKESCQFKSDCYGCFAEKGSSIPSDCQQLYKEASDICSFESGDNICSNMVIEAYKNCDWMLNSCFDCLSKYSRI